MKAIGLQFARHHFMVRGLDQTDFRAGWVRKLVRENQAIREFICGPAEELLRKRQLGQVQNNFQSHAERTEVTLVTLRALKNDECCGEEDDAHD